jgi:hypothetical protein
MPAVRCPACREDISVNPADLGYRVACPLCGERFTPREPVGSSSLGESDAGVEDVRADDPAIERPALERRHEEDVDDFDRPSRRRQPTTIEDAEQIVAWPASGLIWTGIAGSVLCLVVGTAVALFGVVMLNDPQGKGGAWMMIAMGAGGGVGGVPYFLVLFLGGRQLRRLNGTVLVYVAAFLGIATIFWCGILWPTTWAAVTFGIWAIVVVNRAEVKEAIAAANED